MAGRLFNRPGTPKHEFPSQLPTQPGVDNTTVLRQPLFSPGPRQPPQQGFIVPNLLVTTLAVVALAPFIPVDFIAPRAPVPVRADAPPNLLSTTLAPRPPFSQTDWSIAKTEQFVAQFDPPNVTINLPVMAPFTPVDWTNPVRQIFRPTEAAPNVTIGLSVAVQTPFLPLDFAAPRASIRAVTFDPPNLLLTTFAPIAPQPFFPLDWQPQRAQTIVSDAPYQANIALLTAPPPVMPFGQYDWQMPIPQPKPADHSWIPNLLNTTLVPGVSPVVVITQAGGSGKTKYHWEVEQERQERENVQPQASFANVEQNVFLENPSLLAARVELEKARRELETRRNIEKAKGLRKSLKRQGTEPVFADRQAEEAKKLDEEAMLLILLADD